MQTIKTSELIGAALDWAVAKCEGHDAHFYKGIVYTTMHRRLGPECHYSTDWAQGGPIIEREKIGTRFETGCYWHFTTPTDTWLANYEGKGEWLGPTPLIAAMRCYVASKLGDTVELPDELAF